MLTRGELERSSDPELAGSTLTPATDAGRWPVRTISMRLEDGGRKNVDDWDTQLCYTWEVYGI